jgi:signal transduction histidine kinase
MVSCCLILGYYLLGTELMGAWSFKVAVSVGFLLSAVISSRLMARLEGDHRQLGSLALMEAVAVPVLMLFTGGLSSPFAWYGFNPLLVAALYLPTWFTWVVLVVFTVSAAVATLASPLSRGQLGFEDGQNLLVFVLFTLSVRAQARLFHKLSEQARRIEDQSQALQDAYGALKAKEEAVTGLAQFQQDAVLTSSPADLYQLVVTTLLRVFGARWAAVAHAMAVQSPELQPSPWLPSATGIRIEATPGTPSVNWGTAWDRVEEAGPGTCVTLGDDVDAAVVSVEEGRPAAVLATSGILPSRTVELMVLLQYAGQLAGRMAATEKIRRSLDYLSEVYRIVEAVPGRASEQELMDLVTVYAKQLTGAEKAAYWPADPEAPDAIQHAPSVIRGHREGLAVEDLSTAASRWWAAGQEARQTSIDDHIHGGLLWRICHTIVRSSDRRFGILLVLSARPFNMDIDIERAMEFLGCLAGAIMEQQNASELYSKLQLAYEHGRIASDIHDSVSQDLFSITYGLDGAIRTLRDRAGDEVLGSLAAIREVSATVSKEIRASIYHLSEDEGPGAFVKSLGSRLRELGGLHGIDIRLDVKGSEDNLSPSHRRAIQRVIREAISNAVRHGNAREISVELSLDPHGTVVQVRDNGNGFNPPSIRSLMNRGTGGRVSGIGLLSMAQVAASLNGSLKIDSAPGNGCTVTVRMPDYRQEEGEVGEHENPAG